MNEYLESHNKVFLTLAVLVSQPRMTEDTKRGVEKLIRLIESLKINPTLTKKPIFFALSSVRLHCTSRKWEAAVLNTIQFDARAYGEESVALSKCLL